MICKRIIPFFDERIRNGNWFTFLGFYIDLDWHPVGVSPQAANTTQVVSLFDEVSVAWLVVQLIVQLVAHPDTLPNTGITCAMLVECREISSRILALLGNNTDPFNFHIIFEWQLLVGGDRE